MNYREPIEITAGDTVEWTRQLPDYPASAGWVLKYALRGPAVINLSAAASADDHLVTIAANINPALVQGTFNIQGYVEKNTARHTVYRGQLKVDPNLVDADSSFDGRTHVERVLEAIEATIEGTANTDQQEMWLEGDKLSRRTIDDLVSLRQKYRRELKVQIRKERRKQGRNVERLIKYQL